MSATEYKPSSILNALASSLSAESFTTLLAEDFYPFLDDLPEPVHSQVASFLVKMQRDSINGAQPQFVNQIHSEAKKACRGTKKPTLMHTLQHRNNATYTVYIRHIRACMQCVLRVPFISLVAFIQALWVFLMGAKPSASKRQGCDKIRFSLPNGLEEPQNGTVRDMGRLRLTDNHGGLPKGNAHGAARKYSPVAQHTIAAFRTIPTADGYKALILNYPDRVSSLLDAVRDYFFKQVHTGVEWAHAIEIFKVADSRDDMLKVLDRIETSPLPARAVVAGKQEAVSYLMMYQGRYRAKARVHLEKGLDAALSALDEEIASVYPDLDKAAAYLEGQLEALGLDWRTNEPRVLSDFETRRIRDGVLEKFSELAEDYYNPELKDYEADPRRETDDTRRGTADAIQKWAEILDEWPDEVEAAEIRGNLRIRTTDPLYAIDGVALALAERCRRTDAAIHVAESIIEAHFAFGPDGAVTVMKSDGRQ